MTEIVCKHCQKPITAKKDLLVMASGALMAFHRNCAPEYFKKVVGNKKALVVNSSYVNKVTALSTFTAFFLSALLVLATNFLNLKITIIGYYLLGLAWLMFLMVGGLRLVSYLRFESKLK